LTRVFEGLSEALFVGRLVGGQVVADDHRIGIAAAHDGVGEVDGEAIAGLGDDGFDDAEGAVGLTRKMKDGFVDAVVVAIAEGPVGGPCGAAESPVEELRAVLGRLD
jgi:hypothetical protein